MKAGDILVVRTTGEKVYLIAETDRGTWKVRRPNTKTDGAIEHTVDEFFEGELSTIEDFADAQVQEMVIRHTSQKKLRALYEKDEVEVLPASIN